MAFKKSWKQSKHTVKERRAYNVGFALGVSGVSGDSLYKMYNERHGTVGKTSKEVLASLKGFNRGARVLEKKTRK